jgi:predicted aspartyl protease
MVRNQEQTMGRFSVEVELTNDADLVEAERGHISHDKVHRMLASGVVDSGAARLVIPESIAHQLDLRKVGETKVQYADGRTEHRSIVDRIRLSFGGREGLFSAIVEPSRKTILIGAIVLEDLDLLVDCKKQLLFPRDPNDIISEVE